MCNIPGEKAKKDAAFLSPWQLELKSWNVRPESNLLCWVTRLTTITTHFMPWRYIKQLTGHAVVVKNVWIHFSWDLAASARLPPFGWLDPTKIYSFVLCDNLNMPWKCNENCLQRFEKSCQTNKPMLDCSKASSAPRLCYYCMKPCCWNECSVQFNTVLLKYTRPSLKKTPSAGEHLHL